MADAFFYHLEGLAAEDLLPDLLQRGLARGMRMAVETPKPERLSALSARLWSFEDTSFLAHGMVGEPNPERQTIWLTAGPDDPTAAHYRFFFGGAFPADSVACERMFLLFNGDDETERNEARQQWRKLKSNGIQVKYWKKHESGRWMDMAEAMQQPQPE